MKTFLQQHGFVVVPLGGDGTPTGAAFWCATPDEADLVFNEERGKTGAYLLSMWQRPEPKEESCPQKSSSDT